MIISEGKTKVFHSDKPVARFTLVMAKEGKIIPPDHVAVADSATMSLTFANHFAGFVVACQPKPKDPNGLGTGYDVTVMTSGVVLMPCVSGIYLYDVPITIAVVDGKIDPNRVAQANRKDKIGVCRCSNTNPTQIDFELFDNTPAKSIAVENGLIVQTVETQAPPTPESPKPIEILSEEEFNKRQEKI